MGPTIQSATDYLAVEQDHLAAASPIEILRHKTQDALRGYEEWSRTEVLRFGFTDPCPARSRVRHLQHEP